MKVAQLDNYTEDDNFDLYRGLNNWQLFSSPTDIRKYYHDKLLTKRISNKNKHAFLDIPKKVWDTEHISLGFRQKLVFPSCSAWLSVAKKTIKRPNAIVKCNRRNYTNTRRPVKLLSWCPNVSEDRQILAVLISDSDNHYKLELEPKENNDLIQFWDYGFSNHITEKEPSLLCSFEHQWGSIISMQWISPDEPNLKHAQLSEYLSDAPKSHPLLGHMLFCCSDGFMRICSIPKFENSSEDMTFQFNDNNVMRLGLGHDHHNDSRNQFGYPTCAHWLSTFPGRIAAGYSSGHIGIFDLTCVDLFHYDCVHNYLISIHKRRLSYYPVKSIAMCPTDWQIFNYTVDSGIANECSFVYKFTERTLPHQIVKSDTVIDTCIWPSRSDLLVSVPISKDRVDITSILSRKMASIPIDGIRHVVSFDNDNSILVSTDTGSVAMISINDRPIVKYLMTSNNAPEDIDDPTNICHYRLINPRESSADSVPHLVDCSTEKEVVELYETSSSVRYPAINSIDINPNIDASGLAAIGFDCGVVHILRLREELTVGVRALVADHCTVPTKSDPKMPILNKQNDRHTKSQTIKDSDPSGVEKKKKGSLIKKPSLSTTKVAEGRTYQTKRSKTLKKTSKRNDFTFENESDTSVTDDNNESFGTHDSASEGTEPALDNGEDWTVLDQKEVAVETSDLKEVTEEKYGEVEMHKVDTSNDSRIQIIFDDSDLCVDYHDDFDVPEMDTNEGKLRDSSIISCEERGEIGNGEVETEQEHFGNFYNETGFEDQEKERWDRYVKERCGDECREVQRAQCAESSVQDNGDDGLASEVSEDTLEMVEDADMPDDCEMSDKNRQSAESVLGNVTDIQCQEKLYTGQTSDQDEPCDLTTNCIGARETVADVIIEKEKSVNSNCNGEINVICNLEEMDEIKAARQEKEDDMRQESTSVYNFNENEDMVIVEEIEIRGKEVKEKDIDEKKDFGEEEISKREGDESYRSVADVINKHKEITIAGTFTVALREEKEEEVANEKENMVNIIKDKEEKVMFGKIGDKQEPNNDNEETRAIEDGKGEQQTSVFVGYVTNDFIAIKKLREVFESTEKREAVAMSDADMTIEMANIDNNEERGKTVLGDNFAQKTERSITYDLGKRGLANPTGDMETKSTVTVVDYIRKMLDTGTYNKEVDDEKSIDHISENEEIVIDDDSSKNVVIYEVEGSGEMVERKGSHILPEDGLMTADVHVIIGHEEDSLADDMMERQQSCLLIEEELTIADVHVEHVHVIMDDIPETEEGAIDGVARIEFEDLGEMVERQRSHILPEDGLMIADVHVEHVVMDDTLEAEEVAIDGDSSQNVTKNEVECQEDMVERQGSHILTEDELITADVHVIMDDTRETEEVEIDGDSSKNVTNEGECPEEMIKRHGSHILPKDGLITADVHVENVIMDDIPETKEVAIDGDSSQNVTKNEVECPEEMLERQGSHILTEEELITAEVHVEHVIMDDTREPEEVAIDGGSSKNVTKNEVECPEEMIKRHGSHILTEDGLITADVHVENVITDDITETKEVAIDGDSSKNVTKNEVECPEEMIKRHGSHILTEDGLITAEVHVEHVHVIMRHEEDDIADEQSRRDSTLIGDKRRRDEEIETERRHKKAKMDVIVITDAQECVKTNEDQVSVSVDRRSPMIVVDRLAPVTVSGKRGRKKKVRTDIEKCESDPMDVVKVKESTNLDMPGEKIGRDRRRSLRGAVIEDSLETRTHLHDTNDVKMCEEYSKSAVVTMTDPNSPAIVVNRRLSLRALDVSHVEEQPATGESVTVNRRKTLRGSSGSMQTQESPASTERVDVEATKRTIKGFSRRNEEVDEYDRRRTLRGTEVDHAVVDSPPQKLPQNVVKASKTEETVDNTRRKSLRKSAAEELIGGDQDKGGNSEEKVDSGRRRSLRSSAEEELDSSLSKSPIRSKDAKKGKNWKEEYVEDSGSALGDVERAVAIENTAACYMEMSKCSVSLNVTDIANIVEKLASPDKCKDEVSAASTKRRRPSEQSRGGDSSSFDGNVSDLGSDDVRGRQGAGPRPKRGRPSASSTSSGSAVNTSAFKRPKTSGVVAWWKTRSVVIIWRIGRYDGVQQDISGRLFDDEPEIGKISLVRWGKTHGKKFPVEVVEIL